MIVGFDVLDHVLTACYLRGMRERAALSALTVEDLAIVDKVELTFGPGLNVLTGETGAGKSILVGALSLLLGGRASSDMVRAGAKRAVVEALWDLSNRPAILATFEERGIDVPDGELLVRRVISAQGRGRVTLNGQMATVSMLQQLMRHVVDISGQHEHVALLDPDSHIKRVDAYGNLSRLVAAVADAHADVAGLRSGLDALDVDEAEKARREDYLRFQLDEIDSVDPQPGEVEGLELERRCLRNATQLADGARRAEATLYSDDGAVIEALGRVQLELVQLARLDDRFDELSGAASGALAELEELARQLSRHGERAHADPERREAIDDRLEALKRLMRKHGGTIDDVLAAREQMAGELDALVHEEARKTDMEAALAAADAVLEERALRLSAARGKAAKALQRAVQAELESLSMGRTKVKIDLHSVRPISARGAERATITIAPNPGEPARPLHKTASGGELSRLLLAIKRVLAESDDVAAYVFDEIDSGVGGAVAEVIGRKMKETAVSRQVIAITHLAQVAAYADTHARVGKETVKGRTRSTVEQLDEAGTVEELARMLGGVRITKRTRQLAREMRVSASSAMKAVTVSNRAVG